MKKGCVYIVKARCSYENPVHLFDDVGITVAQRGAIISEGEFDEIKRLAGSLDTEYGQIPKDHSYWLCNTDETEQQGKGAYQKMLDQSCIAAWGSCREQGAEKTLNKPHAGDTVFLFCAGRGIIAKGNVTKELAAKSKSVFPAHAKKEFKRPIGNLQKLEHSLSVTEIRSETGYELPYKHTVCEIHNLDAIQFILDRFSNKTPAVAKTVELPVSAQEVGAGFGSPENNRKVEKAAVAFVERLFKKQGYEVKSRERDRIGYDLDAFKGKEELHIEVKGVSGAIPSFIITAKEVQCARVDPSFRLVVVMNARQSKPVHNEMTGKELCAAYDFDPLGFMARRKP